MSSHWPLFTEFCRAETATGGPDPQVALMAHLPRETDPVEQVWLAGCYGAHHCVPSAWLTWNEFRPKEILDDPKELESWLEESWHALPVRPEMKSHRMLHKRSECLQDFARYALDGRWAIPNTAYDLMWHDSQNSVKYYGRYMAIKYLEILRRTVAPWLVMTDMRARGAWSPRRTLYMLFPEEEILGQRENRSDKAEQTVERCATEAIQILGTAGIHVNYFQVQVMLCEYRELLCGGYYAGASHDEELGYISQSRMKFSEHQLAGIFQARKELFPEWCLGELNGWDDIRQDCWRAWKNHGYIWNDLRYVYRGLGSVEAKEERA